MRIKALVLATLALVVTVTMSAQEGYPLTGTWYGDYGTGNARKDLTVIMTWDGKTASGIVNPGPNQAALRNIVLDITPGKPAPAGQRSTEGTPPVFNVTFEADLGAEHLVFNGTLQNPVAGNRRLTGSVTHGTTKAPFQLRRQ